MRLILLFLSTVFIYPNDNNVYTLKTKYHSGEIVKYRTESIMDFQFGSYSNQSNSDFKMVEKYLGEENGFVLIEKTCTDMISTTTTLGEMEVDLAAGQLIGVPYIVYVDSSGLSEDIETEYAQYEETIRSLEMDMSGLNNYIYPFGENAVDIKVGDTWRVEEDSILFFPGDGGFENFMSCNIMFTLNKVKQKGGKSIAFISASFDVSVESMAFSQSSTLFTGKMAGSGKSKIRFDLDGGKRILDKQDMSMRWDVSFEDKHLVETLTLSTKTKWEK